MNEHSVVKNSRCTPYNISNVSAVMQKINLQSFVWGVPSNVLPEHSASPRISGSDFTSMKEGVI